MAYPQFHPFSLGQVITQGENILNSRAQRDPNSLKNQLLIEQLNQYRNPPERLYSLGAGQQLVTGSGDVRATGFPKEQKIPSIVDEFLTAKERGLLPPGVTNLKEYWEIRKPGGTTVNVDTDKVDPFVAKWGKPESGMMRNPGFLADQPIGIDNAPYIAQPGGSKDPVTKYGQKEYDNYVSIADTQNPTPILTI